MTLKLSGYTIKEDIYSSHRSLIYRGRRDSDDRPVILKTPNKAYLTPGEVAQFQREFEITHRLTAEGSVQAYELVQADGRLVLILEDFGGEALSRLTATEKLTLTDFLSVAIQAAEALGHVHQQHIMHKDINPSNLVLNPDTGQLKVIDFGIAAVLSREIPTISNPNVLEGTLAYMSPEQTGRMNRALDYRTDFYSLGATLYELLTGHPPFESTDAMSLVHSHIAKQPTPPHILNPTVPRPVSDIVMKLLAKTAEGRYQSAYGLKADLEECLRQWQIRQQIDPFEIGQHDVSNQFQISQKLYGREAQIEQLLTTFDSIGQTKALMLVTGQAGIGKSALVNEIHKPIVRERGYFITGKFDQFKRNIPYASLIQAFEGLIGQILTESEAEIAAWKEKLAAALGPNGQIITAVIPELALIIGPQPAVAELGPIELQNRFNVVFGQFVNVFAQPEHPLVIFLDDLQWADSASLNLLKLFMTDPNLQNLMIIGAYRDSEVDGTHALTLTLKALTEPESTVVGTIAVKEIKLAPLSQGQIGQLVADTLNCPTSSATNLARLVHAKTNGTPFFVNEFLKSLYQEGLLSFEPSQGRWVWDLSQIRQREMTDNVVDLMVEKLQKLP
ncbi:MAG: AAA family ATPase, partial [Anaerolineae bacterium]|nr:AAA family ATPase [Anaerolineae bacterium]